MCPWRRASLHGPACRWSTDIGSSPRPSSRHPRASDRAPSRDNRHHPMKLPREVPPASFSALGLVCSSKTMARREGRKYSSTMSSSLYVGSVLKVLLDHHRSTYSKQSVGLSAQLSSCDELPRPTDSSSRCSWLVLHLPAQERLAGRGTTMGKQTAVGAASTWACSPALVRSAPRPLAKVATPPTPARPSRTPACQRGVPGLWGRVQAVWEGQP